MSAEDRPQTAFSRLRRTAATLARPFVWVAAAVGLALAAVPPVPNRYELAAGRWAAPPVRASVTSFSQSDWHPAAVKVEALGGKIPGDLGEEVDRTWAPPHAGFTWSRRWIMPREWFHRDLRSRIHREKLGWHERTEAEERAWVDAVTPRFRYIVTFSVWTLLLPAVLWGGWRIFRPAPVRPAGLARRMLRPWVWTMALLGGSAIVGEFADAWGPERAPEMQVGGLIGPAETPHPRLVTVDLAWPTAAADPPNEQTACPQWGVWWSWSRQRRGGFGFGGGGLGGGGMFSLPPVSNQFGGGMAGGLGGGAGGADLRRKLSLKFSLWWLLLPAELANLVTLYRSRPRHATVAR
ncbi:hypothetical protein [Alienimonas chondri]|uniref:Uncharacterized protein n=1 Tax=Alienimonas chondri TaxID=2681879 RepID=A0ABX1VCR2_9PLAN|nr:hypothetical protein [Alienimonas chondri]NNJ24841.1 hypothetical protein [Alienimonas chondri]